MRIECNSRKEYENRCLDNPSVYGDNLKTGFRPGALYERVDKLADGKNLVCGELTDVEEDSLAWKNKTTGESTGIQRTGDTVLCLLVT